MNGTCVVHVRSIKGTKNRIKFVDLIDPNYQTKVKTQIYKKTLKKLLHKQVLIISLKILTSAYIVHKKKISDMLKKSSKLKKENPSKNLTMNIDILIQNWLNH